MRAGRRQSIAAVWLAARAQLRRRRAATVALVVLVGLAAGVVLAALWGASRTETAMDRFVAYNRPVDAAIVVDDPALRPNVMALPQVQRAGRAVYVFMSSSKPGPFLTCHLHCERATAAAR